MLDHGLAQATNSLRRAWDNTIAAVPKLDMISSAECLGVGSTLLLVHGCRGDRSSSNNTSRWRPTSRK